MIDRAFLLFVFGISLCAATLWAVQVLEKRRAMRVERESASEIAPLPELTGDILESFIALANLRAQRLIKKTSHDEVRLALLPMLDIELNVLEALRTQKASSQ